jgi:hypothetical protein
MNEGEMLNEKHLLLTPFYQHNKNGELTTFELGLWR